MGQTNMPPALLGNIAFAPQHHYNQLSDSGALKRKWSLNKFGGLSTGLGFFNGGNSQFISAPIGLQLNRQLTKNLYAFAAVSTAPTYLSFNNSFSGFNAYKTNSGMIGYHKSGFGNYSRAEAGLMYINDERTFSISGSFGVSNYYQQFPAGIANPPRQPVFTGSK